MVTHATTPKHICSACGGSTESISGIKESIIPLDDLLKVVENHHDVEICKCCGHANIAISPKQDFPVIPNRTIGCDLMLHSFECFCMGSPMTRSTHGIREQLEIGNNTLYYNMMYFSEIYLKPLYNFIIEAAKNANDIVADGTPFPCMKAMGKRDCKINKEIKEQGKEVESHFKNYVLSITSVPCSDTKFANFSFLYSRSTEEIKKVITKDLKFKLIVTDAYSGYDKLVRDEHPKDKLQNCLIHARREIIKAFNPNEYANALDSLNEEERNALLTEDIKHCKTKFLLYMAFEAIDKIYAIERSVDKTKHNALDDLLKARKQSRELMNHIDGLLIHVIFKGNKWQALKGADQYNKVCVYWKNNSSKFKIFLDEPTIPADSNGAES